MKKSFSFIAIGATQESKEGGEGFKRYVGLGSTFVKGVQPTKKEVDEFFGYESAEPEYVVDTDNGKEVRITFLIETDPEQNNGIDIKNRAMFTLRKQPAYNRDQTKVEVIDSYGNHTWANAEDAKAGKPVVSENGNPKKIDTKYRIACDGECALVDFLKNYLCIPDAFNYVNGVWVKKDDADKYEFGFTPDDFKKFFAGDFKGLKDAIALQPNNKVKMLYGVRTNDEGKQYQAVCTREGMVLRNSAGTSAISKLERDLANAKQNGAFSSIEYKVQELQEYNVNPTNLETPAPNDDPFPTGGADPMPW